MSDALDEFFKWIGICITEWARVEDQLYLICHKCLRTTYDLTSVVYYRIPQLDARLGLVDELVRATLPKRKRQNGGHDHPDLKQWGSIRKEIETLLHIRRRIAHHQMRGFIDLETSKGIGVHIEPSFAETLRGRGDDHLNPLEQTDLEQHVIKLQDVVNQLAQFYQHTLPKHSR
jgi:hypothetical protein